MSKLTKGLLISLAAYVVIKALEANQAGRVFSLSELPILGQIMAPAIDPVADTSASYSGYEGASMSETLMAIDANPGLVADLTPQGQYRIDTRQIG